MKRPFMAPRLLDMGPNVGDLLELYGARTCQAWRSLYFTPWWQPLARRVALRRLLQVMATEHGTTRVRIGWEDNEHI